MVLLLLGFCSPRVKYATRSLSHLNHYLSRSILRKQKPVPSPMLIVLEYLVLTIWAHSKQHILSYWFPIFMNNA